MTDSTVPTWLARQPKRSLFILSYSCGCKCLIQQRQHDPYSSIMLSGDSKSRCKMSSKIENQTLGFFVSFSWSLRTSQGDGYHRRTASYPYKLPSKFTKRKIIVDLKNGKHSLILQLLRIWPDNPLEINFP